MHQVLFHIPYLGIPVFGFGMMLFLAFILCTMLAGRRAEREGISRERIQDLAIWLFIGGLLGARVVYLINNMPQGAFAGGVGGAMHGIWELIKALPRIWDGGIVLYGAIVGGLLAYAAAYWFLFRDEPYFSTLKLTDILAPAIALGLCLGRIGCLLNGCCYGQVACEHCPKVHFPLCAPARADLTFHGYQTAAGFLLDDGQPSPARVARIEPGSPAEQAGLQPGDVLLEANHEPIDSIGAFAGLLTLQWPRGETRLNLKVKHPDGEEATLPAFEPRTLGLHPTQLYESISMAILLVAMLAFHPYRTRYGQITAGLMICYAFHRYLNELLRGDPRPVQFEHVGSIVAFLGGVAILVWTWRSPATKVQE